MLDCTVKDTWQILYVFDQGSFNFNCFYYYIDIVTFIISYAPNLLQ